MSIFRPYTPVADNTLLPFGANRLDGAPNAVSDEISLTDVFEDGFRFGDQTFSSFWLSSNGGISFNGPEIFPSPWYDYTILGLQGSFTPDTSDPEDSGIFWDINTDRDSLVFTWNKVGVDDLYYPDDESTATFQLELLDLGGGDAEVIFRYGDMVYTEHTAYSAWFGGLMAGWNTTVIPNSADVDDIAWHEFGLYEGNTGVEGVWQFYIEDGEIEPGITAEGTSDNDHLIGSLRGDNLFGKLGDDTLEGEDGDDVLEGDNGHDIIEGGGGYDTILGGAGNDTLLGGADSDQISGQAGDDEIYSNLGNDLVWGGEGADLILESWDIEHMFAWDQNDTLHGGAGDDTISGAFGYDSITGGDGNDKLRGGEGSDVIWGGEGNDTMAGGTGGDRLHGGLGDDFIFGDTGYNRAEGGEGADTFLLSPTGTMYIEDFNADEGDRLIVDGDLYQRSDFYARPNNGRDILYDADGNIVLTSVDILYRNEDDRLVQIAEIELVGGGYDITLSFPTLETENVAPILWDFS